MPASDEGPGVVAGVTVVDAYAAEPVTADVGAIYLTIGNQGEVADTLVGARAPVAEMVHLHRMTPGSGARMRVQDVAVVPGHGQLRLRPGGLHLMLMNLSSRPIAGDTIALALEFRHAGTVHVRVPVVSYLEVGERAAVGMQDDSE
jgi:copper(I)-binding protein